MKIFFDKCYQAIAYCNANKSYGLFYSEKHDEDINMHVHECCEVLLCLSGGRTFFINDRIYDVNSGDIFIMNQFEAHKITADKTDTFRRFVFQIHPSFLYSNSSENTDLSNCFYQRSDKISHKITLSNSEMEYFTSQFLSLRAESTFGDDLIKNATVLLLLTHLNQYFIESNQGYKYIPENDNKIISDAVKYISDNLSEELTLKKVATNSLISVNQLCRLFKKHLGTTVIKYITTKRITEAKKMLKKGNTVSEVSLACGFSDYSNFIRTFKNIVGVPPGKYARTVGK